MAFLMYDFRRTVWVAFATFFAFIVLPVVELASEGFRTGLLADRGVGHAIVCWAVFVGIPAFFAFLVFCVMRETHGLYRKSCQKVEFCSTFGFDFFPRDDVEKRAAQRRVDETITTFARSCFGFFAQQEAFQQEGDIDPVTSDLNAAISARRGRSAELTRDITRAKSAFWSYHNLAQAVGFQVEDSIEDYRGNPCLLRL